MVVAARLTEHWPVMVGSTATLGTGAVPSFSVTVKVVEAVPHAFTAFTTTVVTPVLNTDPLPVPLPLPVVAPLKVYVSVGVLPVAFTV